MQKQIAASNSCCNWILRTPSNILHVTQTCSCFVLAGGKSSRFGANKSLALVGSQPMALVVANNLQTAFGSAARLVGSDAQTCSQIGLDSIFGTREGNGPLAAIIDAMEICAASLVAFAPNDTPFFSADNFSALLAKIEQSGSDAVVVVDDLDPPQTHWLLSIWHVDRCLTTLRNEYDRGVRSIHGAVSGLQIATIMCGAASVRNINTVSDMPDQGTI